MQYRADIDGLRAFAVLSVVWFHAGLGGTGGGFTGVDVFYVISGYLIGGIIVDETAAGRFSYLQFYTRRAKRLFAAFFVVALATMAVGWWLLLPTDFRQAGRSLVAATTFISNVVFHRDAGYFDSASITKPLLHTWSLSVEEQFYIIFPLLMRAVLRLRRDAVPAVLVAAALLSFAWSQAMMSRDPGGAFYLLPSRAWEMLLGTLVALPQARASQVPEWLQRLVTPLAVAGLCVPVFFYTERTPFPAVGALPSCAGTAWLLWWGGRNGQSLVGRLLGAPVPVFIGKISYSLYLWHWPVIVYLTYFCAGQLTWAWGIAAMLASLALAAASWRWVEQPVRRSARSPAIVLGSAAVGSLLLLLIGLLIWRSDGMPSRLVGQTAQLANAAADFMQPREGCEAPANSVWTGVEYCRLGPEGRPEFLVWGDSHARALRDGLDQLASERNTPGVMFWAGGCMPLLDVRKKESATGPGSDAACLSQNLRIRQILEEGRLTVRRALLVGRWAYYAEGRGTGSDAGNEIRLLRAGTDGPQSAIFSESLRETVAWLRGKGIEVLILEQPPEIPDFSSRRLFQMVRSGRSTFAEEVLRIGTVRRSEVEQRQLQANAALNSVAAGGLAGILRTHPLFCSVSDCSAIQSFGPAYFDNNHVRSSTSRWMRNLFIPVVVP